MKKQSIGYIHETWEETSLKDFKGKWALINLGNEVVSGKIHEIKGHEFGLMPYMGINYDEGFPKYEIVCEGNPMMKKKSLVTGYRPTSEKSTRGFCEYHNRKVKIEKLNEEIAISNLEKQIKNFKK